MRGKDGKFMRDWRAKLVKDMAARSRYNIERANRKLSGMPRDFHPEARQENLK